MTIQEQEKRVHQLRFAVKRAVAKHRPENINLPTPHEYM